MVISDTSTLPPSHRQVVRVEVAKSTTGVGKLVTVKVVVEVGGAAVEVDGATVDDSDSDGPGVVWLVIDSGVFWIELRGTVSQASRSSIRKLKTIKVLRTPGVYHNKVY